MVLMERELSTPADHLVSPPEFSVVRIVDCQFSVYCFVHDCVSFSLFDHCVYVVFRIFKSVFVFIDMSNNQTGFNISLLIK